MQRDRESLRRHYEVERELADRLRAAVAVENRLALYRTVYNELFRRVPDHPQLCRKRDPGMQRAATDRQMRLLGPWLRTNSTYLEVGPGDCHLAVAIARRVRRVYAVDISEEIAGGNGRPGNFALVHSDGVSIPVPAGTVDVAYSHQLLEHLHPDDATEHLHEVFRALTPGGVYICVTPHRFSGPHDISKYFDEVATGFHLKEYIYEDLRSMFRRAGFASTWCVVGIKGRFLRLPDPLSRLGESAVGLLPGRLLRVLTRRAPLRSGFDSVTIIGRKGRAAGPNPCG